MSAVKYFKLICAVSLAFACGHAAAARAASRLPEGLVFLRDVDPTIIQDIRYATTDNFTGAKVQGYSAECVLRRDAGEALARVQKALKRHSLSLKVYDCYRPLRSANAMVDWARSGRSTPAQKRFFPHLDKGQLVPAGYITRSGSHSRGVAVDLTLVSMPPRVVASFDPAKVYGPCDGPEAARSPDNSVDMGTGFDCFDLRSHTDSPAITASQKHWRQVLVEAMRAERFVNYSGEWWHFKLAPDTDSRTFDIDIPPHQPATAPRAAPSRGEPWTSLPISRPMPTGGTAGYVFVPGAKIFYRSFGSGPAVILLHGGLANGEYWASQVDALKKQYRVIVIDSRGHGRSTWDGGAVSYDLMASDVLGVMNELGIGKASIVGWSDGAIVGLTIASCCASRVERLFAFGANASPSGLKAKGKGSALFALFFRRAVSDYRRLSAAPDNFDRLATALRQMWRNEPNFTAADLARIRIVTVIALAQHDEIISQETSDYLARHIKNARMLVLPRVSHFAMLQDPKAFNAELLSFLNSNRPPLEPGRK